MSSSVTPFSLCLPSKIPLSFLRRFNFSSNQFSFRARSRSNFLILASTAERNSAVEFSWISRGNLAPDDYNGWAITEDSAPEPVTKKGLYTFAVIGASVTGIIGLLAYLSFSGKGFGHRLISPVTALHNDSTSEETNHDELLEEGQELIEDLGDPLEDYVATETNAIFVKEQMQERIIVPFAADFAQEEAILALKRLKIIEDDARANELCTRREYARWLVRANSLLESCRKHRICSSAALSGSRIAAFDDVGVEDPDFEYIQSLAEAGIVRSNLSNGNSGSSPNNADRMRRLDFNPERYISRQNLIVWKATLEYGIVPRTNEEMSRKNIGFLDVKEISPDALRELFMDIRADEKSIIRRVFGQSKRLQPNKPCTKAQAAVALSGGRMTELIQAELSRLEAENLLRENEMEEVRSELLERGNIQKYWESKMEETKSRALEVEMDYHSTIAALEEEKTHHENALAELIKQKAALDCQEQLLSSLKAEVNDMSERLRSERAQYMEERCSMHDALHDLQLKYERLLDEKTILEAEVEALRILRSWVEDEAKKSQERVRVLEEAKRRWKWER